MDVTTVEGRSIAAQVSDSAGSAPNERLAEPPSWAEPQGSAALALPTADAPADSNELQGRMPRIAAPGEPQELTQPAAPFVIARGELQALPEQPRAINRHEPPEMTQPVSPVGETADPAANYMEQAVARVSATTETSQSGIQTPADPRRLVPS